ncbi:MAG: hypothetical protein JSW73_04855 [Candidatus Woesearchaeota archaeon]|nr:MAG: hypothetical protein JSW73_04855 [Candidatus Woesearchaeota archaeon]
MYVKELRNKKFQKIFLASIICVFILLIAKSVPVEACCSDSDCQPPWCYVCSGWSGDPLNCDGSCTYTGSCPCGTCKHCSGDGCSCVPDAAGTPCGTGNCNGYFLGWESGPLFDCMQCTDASTPRYCNGAGSCNPVNCAAHCGSSIVYADCQCEEEKVGSCLGWEDPSNVYCTNCRPQIVTVQEKDKPIDLHGADGLPYEFTVEIEIFDADIPENDPIDVIFTSHAAGLDVRTCNLEARPPYPDIVECEITPQLQYAGIWYDWEVIADDLQSVNNLGVDSDQFKSNAYPEIEYDPPHESTDVSLEPVLTATISDEDFAFYYDDDSIDIYFYSPLRYLLAVEIPFARLLRPFYLGQIIPAGTSRDYKATYDWNNNGVIDKDSRCLEYKYDIERLCYSRTYIWQVVATDKILREFYDDRVPGAFPIRFYSLYSHFAFFTTEPNYAPTVSLIYPADGDDNVPLDPTVKVQVTDDNNDEMDVTFNLYDAGMNLIQTGTVTDVENGAIVPFLFMGLEEKVVYFWSVEACDTHWEVCSGDPAEQECTTAGPWTFTTHNLEGVTDRVLANEYGVYDHTEYYAALHEHYWFTFIATDSYDVEDPVEELSYTWHFGDGQLCWTDELEPIHQCSCGTLFDSSVDTHLVWCMDQNGDTIIDEFDGYWDMNNDDVVDIYDCLCLDTWDSTLGLPGQDGILDENDFGVMNRNGDGEDLNGDGIWDPKTEPPILNEEDCTFGALYSGCRDVIGGDPPDCVDPGEPDPDGDVDDCDYQAGYIEIYGDRNRDGDTDIRDCNYAGRPIFYSEGKSEAVGDRCVIVKHKYSHSRAHTYIVNLTVTDTLGHSTSEVKDLVVRGLICDEEGIDPHTCCYMLPNYKRDGEYAEQTQPCEAELDKDCWHVYMYHQSDCPDPNQAWGCVPQDLATIIHAQDAALPLGCEAIEPLNDDHRQECEQFRQGCGEYDCGIFTTCYYSWQCKYSPDQAARVNELCIDASSTYDEGNEHLKPCCISLGADPCEDEDKVCLIPDPSDPAGEKITVNCYDEKACNCAKYVRDTLGLPGGEAGIVLDDWAGCHPWRYWNDSNNKYCFDDEYRYYQTEEECENDPINPPSEDCDCEYFSDVFRDDPGELGCVIREIIIEVKNVPEDGGCTFRESTKWTNWIIEAFVTFFKFLAWIFTEGIPLAFRIVLYTLGEVIEILGSPYPCDMDCLVEQDVDGNIIDCLALDYQPFHDNDLGCTIEVDRMVYSRDEVGAMADEQEHSCISPDVFKQCRVGNLEDGLDCDFTTERCTCQDIDTKLFNCLNKGTQLRDTISEATIDPPAIITCIGAKEGEEPRDDIPLEDGVCNIGEVTGDGYTITGYKPLPSTPSDPDTYEDCYFRGYGYEYSHDKTCVCDNGLPLNKEIFPINGQKCTAVQAYRGILICDRSHSKVGVWDASEDHCVTCLRNLEEFNIADKDGAYPKGRSEREGGSKKCESACGSDPYCDEVAPLEYPKGSGSGQEEPQCGNNMLRICNKDCQAVTSSVCYSTIHDPDISSEEGDSCHLEINPQCQLRPPGSVCCAENNGDGVCDGEPGDIGGLCTEECQCVKLVEYFNFELNPGLTLISYPLLEPEEGSDIHWLGSSNDLCYSIPTLRAVETSTIHGPVIFQHNVTTVCGELDQTIILMYPDVAYLLDIAESHKVGFTLWGQVPEGDREVNISPGWNWFGFTSLISHPVSKEFGGVFDLKKFPYIYTAAPNCALNLSEVLE